MSNRYYSGPLSHHFDGTRFFHPGLPPTDKSLLDILKWKIQETAANWPKELPATRTVRPAPRVTGLQITHIGHASYLVQTSGYNILVDPVFAKRASPFSVLGPRRHNPPAIAFDDLPRIDVVLITHNHYDHLDTEAVAQLWKAHHPQIISPFGNDTIIRGVDSQIDVQTGDWWDTLELAQDMRVTIVPAYHWSSRTIGDNRMALWGGFVLETPAGTIYCAGDTAYRDGAIFHEIATKFPSIDVAMLPIGAYAPRWFMKAQHADPQEAIQIARDLSVQHALGVHWYTFQLTDEPPDEPAERLDEAMRTRNDGEITFIAFKPGDTWMHQRLQQR